MITQYSYIALLRQLLLLFLLYPWIYALKIDCKLHELIDNSHNQDNTLMNVIFSTFNPSSAPLIHQLLLPNSQHDFSPSYYVTDTQNRQLEILKYFSSPLYHHTLLHPAKLLKNGLLIERIFLPPSKPMLQYEGRILDPLPRKMYEEFDENEVHEDALFAMLKYAIDRGEIRIMSDITILNLVAQSSNRAYTQLLRLMIDRMELTAPLWSVFLPKNNREWYYDEEASVLAVFYADLDTILGQISDKKVFIYLWASFISHLGLPTSTFEEQTNNQILSAVREIFVHQGRHSEVNVDEMTSGEVFKYLNDSMTEKGPDQSNLINCYIFLTMALSTATLNNKDEDSTIDYCLETFFNMIGDMSHVLVMSPYECQIFVHHYMNLVRQSDNWQLYFEKRREIIDILPRMYVPFLWRPFKERMNIWLMEQGNDLVDQLFNDPVSTTSEEAVVLRKFKQLHNGHSQPSPIQLRRLVTRILKLEMFYCVNRGIFLFHNKAILFWTILFITLQTYLSLSMKIKRKLPVSPFGIIKVSVMFGDCPLNANWQTWIKYIDSHSSPWIDSYSCCEDGSALGQYLIEYMDKVAPFNQYFNFFEFRMFFDPDFASMYSSNYVI